MKKKKQSPYIHLQGEWKQLYNDGLSYREIGKRYGVGYGSVKTVLRGVVEQRPKQTYAHFAEEWVKLYKEGYSANEIAEKYQVDTATVTKYLKREGVELRRQPTKERHFEHLTETWIALYEEGKSLREIAEEYGTFPQTVHKYIKEKTDMRWYTETSRHYEINENYFDSIDSQEKAYWLGILYSSGSVINDITGGGIQLSMSQKDQDRVEAFQQTLGTDKPIQERVDETINGHQVFLRIHNKHMYETVQRLGLVEDKTNTLQFPEFLDPNYLSAFVLGYFEGKGSVYHERATIKGKVYWKTALHFWGTPSFLHTLKEKMKQLLNIEFYLAEHQDNNFQNIRNTGYVAKILSLNLHKQEDIKKFADWLYRGKTEYSQKRDIRTFIEEAKRKNGKEG